jgi:hypothetical protein
MTRTSLSVPLRQALRWAAWLPLATALLLAPARGQPPAAPDPQAGAAALKARYASLQGALAQNQFKQPLHLASTEAPNELKGDIHAVLAQPFPAVGTALQARENWCDILILHLNVKQCATPKGAGITVHVGKKFDQPLADAYKVDFAFRVAAQSAGFLQVQLNAPEGPVGTRDYRIVLEAVPLDDTHTFVHMSYAYGYGMAARVAMQAYLSTAGSDKVGFSMAGRDADGQPAPVRGVRGVVERNTMRYYLAIESYLNARATPAPQQLDKRLHDWYAATERYARQLHEMDEQPYLDMKYREVRRQQQNQQQLGGG